MDLDDSKPFNSEEAEDEEFSAFDDEIRSVGYYDLDEVMARIGGRHC
jgi:hypothetical protein